jgi:outer membrane protein TolC
MNGTNFMDQEIDANYGGKGVQDLYTFRTGADLTLPLLRGRGSASVAAGERAAKAEQTAAQLTYRHQNSASAVRTVHAYWDLRAAQENVDVAQRSLGLQDRLLEATQRLINGGEMPAADLARVQASQTRARARVEDARRRLHEASVNLALAMGITVTDDPASLPAAKDPFPTPQAAALPSDEEVKSLVAAAPAQREDLKAAAARVESGALLLRGAKADTRMRLDLTGRTWMTALGEINASDAIDRWIGPSFSASLGVEIPLGNNFYRGRSLQRQADLRQREISSAELARQIRLNVVRNAGTLREAATRVEQAEQAVGFARKTVDAEIEKFQAGDSTLVDTIITEEQSTEALMSLVSAQADYAHLVAQLRYETGTLAPDAAAVTPDSLVALPR